VFAPRCVAALTMRAMRGGRVRTPGHPENFHTAGIEVSTGPLGQGECAAVSVVWTHISTLVISSGVSGALVWGACALSTVAVGLRYALCR
jgi:hypothetical protein